MAAQKFLQNGANDGTDATFVQVAVASVTGVPGLLRGYIAGGNCSAAGGSTTFSINNGIWTSDDNTASMVLASNYTKTMAAWAVGSGNGSLDAGSVATNTWYHVFVIERTDTGVVDVLTSLSATAPTLPAGYTKQKRTWSFKTDATPNILASNQNGDETVWSVFPQDANVTNPGTAAVLVTLSVPPGVKVIATFASRAVQVTTSQEPILVFTSPDQSDQAPGAFAMMDDPTSSNYRAAGFYHIRTNTSAQIRYRVFQSDVNTSINIFTTGWIDSNRRFN